MKLLTELDSLDNVKDGETRKLVTKATSSGSGNVVSSVSVSGDTVTYTKGVTAVTDANYVHTDNNFTTTLKNKLDGIASGAEVNQNAFSNVKVGSTTVAADSKTDTLELVAGSNITLTPDATNDKVTIAATDTNTTYTFATGDNNGQIKITPSNGSAQNVSVKGLGSLAYKDSLSKSDVGLGNVDNTSDANKPISTATQTALDKKAKYLSLGSCADFQRVVVGLCELSANASSGTSSHTSGSIVTIRSNGLVPEYVTNFVFQDQYSGAKSCNYSFMGNFENTSTTLRQGEGFRACTFTYNNKYYAGLEFYQTQARSFYWYGESDFTPFLVAYYNFSTGAVLNAEINNSITHSGSVLNRKNIVVDEAKKATGDKNGNDITTTYYLASNPNGYTSNAGTITGITMNGASKGTSGVVDLGTVLTSHQSIKTINNNTITGTGNVSVGTITKVQANGTDVASSGTANIPAATTSKYGVTELSSATNSTSEALAATPKAVKAAYDLAASKGTGTITGVSVNGTSVATSGVANITSMPASILSGAIPSAVTATTQSASDNSTKIATTAFVQTAIDNLPEPMVFKGSLGTGGTITALPTNGTATIGDTYKVITAGTYASKAAKVGDTFICLTKTSSANTWELIPSGDEPGGTVTSVTLKATSPIAIDSSSAITTSGERTISHANSGVTAGTYRSVTVNATGHVTAGTNPTTLSGYGITDAKIASGVITLGSNTITPLTASSTLDATKVSGTLPTSTYTNTKNTAGSTDSSSKLFLIGATSQAANPQTYSQDTAYVDTNGHLYSNSKQVVNLSDSQALTNKTYNGYTLAAACAKAVVTSIDTSASLPTSNAVKTFVEGKGYVTTDTKNTAGSTDTSSKIFLIGATSQAANLQTYSDNEVYATSGVLTTKSVQVGGTAATMQYNSTDKCIEFVFA